MRLLILALALAACVHYQPGQGVTPDFAERWGCPYDDVAVLAAERKAALPAGKVYIPQVGWGACYLMASNGRPTRVDHQQTEYGRSVTWWYHASGSTEAHMITLRPKGESWTVSYVGW